MSAAWWIYKCTLSWSASRVMCLRNWARNCWRKACSSLQVMSFHVMCQNFISAAAREAPNSWWRACDLATWGYYCCTDRSVNRKSSWTVWSVVWFSSRSLGEETTPHARELFFSLARRVNDAPRSWAMTIGRNRRQSVVSRSDCSLTASLVPSPKFRPVF